VHSWIAPLIFNVPQIRIKFVSFYKHFVLRVGLQCVSPGEGLRVAPNVDGTTPAAHIQFSVGPIKSLCEFIPYFL